MNEKKIAKRRLNVCMLGHFGHGKTTLTAAMVKVLSKIGTVNVISDESSQNPYEHIPIACERVIYETSGKHYAHYDCVNHIDQIKFMIAGQEPIDGAILVVSSIDGVMPETEEQLHLAKKINIPNIFVFLNKIDLVKDRELIEINEMEIGELLNSCGYDETVSIVAGSAQKGCEYKGSNLDYEYWKPIVELVLKINTELPQPKDKIGQPFLMAVEDVFDVKGKGIAVAGTTKRGRMAIGNSLELVGPQGTVSTRCTGMIEDIDSLQTLETQEERREKRTW